MAQAREQLPDLILCDVNMDKAGAGYATLAKLREDVTTAAIPFILMTGLADAAGMRHGMDLGADDYLPKPFKVDELYATVNARLRKVQTVREEAEKKLTLLRSQISLMLPHEMRTPLNGIISNAEMLAESPRFAWTRKTISEMSQEICQSGQRLERLIENFLIYAQLEIVGHRPSKHQSPALGDHAQARRNSCARRPSRRAKRPGAWTISSWTWPTRRCPWPEDIAQKSSVELVQNALKFSGRRARPCMFP